MRNRIVGALCLAALCLAPVAAQQKFDRKQVPPAGPAPALRVPAWTTSKLANGADFIVSERHGLPLVSFTITLVGGANQFEPANKRGLASMTAAMMREGTKTRSGEQLAVALQMLGTNVGVSVDDESGALSFTSTAETFPATLEILTDMLVNSTFPADALERLRAQRLIAIQRANAQPRSIANRVYSRTLYGPAHPYGQEPDEASIKAITREDVAAFHKAYFQPGRAIVTVVGDVKPETIKATIDKALAGWPAGGDKPAFTYPALPASHPMTIFLVDKPGAAQSTFAIGNPGPPRSTKDYAALQVMNMMLGGHIQSRLSANIREEKGYSYGVSSSFAYGRGPGPFRAGGDIVTAKTDAALVEFMKELRGIQGARPITDDELAMTKDMLIQRLPGQFGSVGGINAAITTLALYGLPPTYYQDFVKAVSAVTKEDVVRVAKQYVDLEHLSIVIVGDRATVEGPLKATGIAPVVLLNADGTPAS
ncbi:MAG TPA: pitrilysin family protein [Vicinamibacterales bacterium]